MNAKAKTIVVSIIFFGILFIGLYNWEGQTLNAAKRAAQDYCEGEGWQTFKAIEKPLFSSEPTKVNCITIYPGAADFNKEEQSWYLPQAGRY